MKSILRFMALAVFMLAANAAEAAKRVALVFSAERYNNLATLKNPGNDADAVEKALEKLGFNVFSEADRDLKKMRRALEDFREDARGAEVALIFFAGHGMEVAGENRLMPVDADASSLARLRETSLSLEELRAAALAVAPTAILFMDACRNDPFGESGGEGRSAKALAAEVRAAARPGLGRMGQAENTLYAFAAAPGKTASDGTGGNSPFSAGLAKHLGTGGLEIRSVLTLVQQEVYAETGGVQTPYVESGLPSLFFAAETGVLDERDTLLLAMAEVTADMRADVEAIAAEKAMPLAPLYGALISADLMTLPPEKRQAGLTEAASAYVETQTSLKRLSSSDPEVTRLRGEAEKALSLGAFFEARAHLAAAARADAESGEALAGNLVKRRLSEAATHEADAGVAKAQLDYGAAADAYERAAVLHERIEKEDVPDQSRQDRTRILAELGDLHVQTGNSGAAQAAYMRMQAAAEMRLAKAPGSADADRDLSVSLNKIGDVKAKQGDGAGALIAYENSLAIFQRLASQDPANAGWQRDLSVSLNKIGDVKAAQGDGAGALKAYEEDLAIAQRLASQDPANSGWQHDLSVSFERIGDVKAAQGDGAGALKAYEDSLAIAERLAAQDGANADWQRDQSVSLDRIGDVNAAHGNSAGALKAYEDSLAIHLRLAAQDPANAGWQRDLSVSFEKIGDVKAAQGDGAGALKAYENSLAIRQRLASQDPANAEWQRDLSVSLNKIGDVKAAQGDGAGALKAYEEDLAIAQRLAAQDPTNAEWQRDLIVSHVKLSQAGGDARAHLTAALRIAEAMAAKGILAPVDAWMLGDLRERLAKLE